MAFEKDNNEETNELAWDLRQIYARLVGEHMIDVAIARKNTEFFKWFKALEDIKTIINHKFTNKDEDIPKYKELLNNVKTLANKYPGAWRGTTSNSQEIAEIETALRNLEEFLYLKMEDAKMFGSGYMYDEDEI